MNSVSTRRSFQRNRVVWYYAFLALPLAFLVFFAILPVLWAFYLSFNQYFAGHYFWVGSGNYTEMIQDSIFWKALANTSYYSVFSVPLGVVISLVISALIFRLGKRMRVFFKSAFYLPSITSLVVLSIVWTWMYQPDGLINHVLSIINIGPFYWLANAKLAMASLIFMYLASSHGAGIILLTAAMGNIPKDLYESGKLDGTSWFQEFYYITLPLLKPTILYLMIMGTINSFQVFTQIYLMTEGGPAHATETLVHYIFRMAFDLFNFGRASAMAIVLFLVIIGFSLIQYKYLSSDVQY